MDDPRIKPLLQAASSLDRSSYGFTPIPEIADVRLELGSGNGYDAMLHIDGKTSRTIAFRKVSGGWRWVGEQESFRGPRTYKTADGTFYEQIVLTYETEHVSGAPLNKLDITYFGEDPRLGSGVNSNLTLDKVRPILKEWGY